jgi:hypothetical protein
MRSPATGRGGMRGRRRRSSETDIIQTLVLSLGILPCITHFMQKWVIFMAFGLIFFGVTMFGLLI